MLYVILLLILAVLLFGSSVVLRGIGIVLGSIVAFIALVWFFFVTGLNPIAVLFFGLIGFFALCGLVILVAKIIEPYETRWHLKKMTAEREAEMQFVSLPPENPTGKVPIKMSKEKRAAFHDACYGKITWEQYYEKWGHEELTDLLAADERLSR